VLTVSSLIVFLTIHGTVPAGTGTPLAVLLPAVEARLREAVTRLGRPPG